MAGGVSAVLCGSPTTDRHFRRLSFPRHSCRKHARWRTVRYLLLAVAASLALSGCGSPAEGATPETTAAPETLPDGRTPTVEQQAFLDEVTPSLTDEHAKDVLSVLSEGESMCTVFTDPSSAQAQQTAVEFMTQDGRWNVTEATVIAQAGAAHFCD